MIAPILALVGAVALGLVLLFKSSKSLLQRNILWSTPGVILLQIGTFVLVSERFQDVKLLGARIVILSLCLLTPISTRLALLWGKLDGGEALKRFRLVLILQWLASTAFGVLVLYGPFLLLTTDPHTENVISYGRNGQYFLVYLMISSVFILSIFERKLRWFRNFREIRIPTIIFMGIFGLFVIAASQGLLIRTLNENLLMLISLSIFLGYVTPLIFSFKNVIAFDKLLDSRETMYSSFMALLIGAYLILIGVFGKILAEIGGDVQVFFSVLAAIALTFILFMVMMSFSLKARIRKFIDKAFYQGQFDYRAIWSRFSEETSFVLNLDELTDSILHTITDIVQVKNGAILLVNEDSTHLHLIKKKMLYGTMKFICPATTSLSIGCGGLGNPSDYPGKTT